MKKIGFTLAEVLLAMAIIGTISALTIPAAVNEYNKRVYGVSLAAAVSDFNTAMGTMIIKENVDSFIDTRAYKELDGDGLNYYTTTTGKEFVKKLQSSIKLKVVGSTLINFYTGNVKNCIKTMKINGIPNATCESLDAASDYYSGKLSDYLGLIADSGVIYWLNLPKLGSTDLKTTTREERKYIENAGGNLTNKLGDVLIDINGREKPNVVGRDIFTFALGYDGQLYAAGSKDWALFHQLGQYRSWLWDSNSASGKTCINGRIISSYNCTANLIESNYKMNY